MEFKFNKGASESSPQDAEGAKKKQQLQLLVLLILVGGLAYVYFFTGLIRPKEVPPTPVAPAPQVVKQPMPPREGEAVKPAAEGTGAPAPAEVKPEPPKEAAKAQPAQPAPVRQEAAKKPEPAVKPDPPKKAEPPKKVEATARPAVEKQAEKKQPPAEKKAKSKPSSSPAKVEGMGAAPSVAAVGKVSGETKPAVPAVKAEKKVPSGREAPKARESGGSWSVIVGNYLLEDALSADLARLRKAGFSPKIVPGEKKKASMNRLALGEFNDRAAAQAELEKLRKHTADAFVLELGGRFGVFAGSYLLDARAASEKERLAAAGINLTLKKVEVTLATRSLAITGFSDRKSAAAALDKVSEAGLKGALRQ